MSQRLTCHYCRYICSLDEFLLVCGVCGTLCGCDEACAHLYGIGTDVEVWAGICGLEQDEETFALRPVTGWLARKFDSAAVEKSIFTKANTPDSFYGIRIAVDSIPPVLKEFTHIYSLDVTFNEEAYLPEWFGEIRIDRLVLRGKIPLNERRKVKKWFPRVEFKKIGAL